MRKLIIAFVVVLFGSACSSTLELETVDILPERNSVEQTQAEQVTQIDTRVEARSTQPTQGNHGILNHDRLSLETGYAGNGEYKILVVFTRPAETIETLRAVASNISVVVDETLLVPALKSESLQKWEELSSESFIASSLTVFVPDQNMASNFNAFLEQANRQEETLNDIRVYGHNQFVQGHREGYQPFIPEDLKERIDKIRDLYDVNVYGIRVLWEEDLDLVDRWTIQLERALSLLGSEFISEIQNNTRGPSLGIRLEPSLGRWHTGVYDWYINTLQINLYPYMFHPYDYEYLSENGYSDEEMLYVWIHEITHAWQEAQRAQDFDFVESFKPHIDTSRSPTTYGAAVPPTGINNYEEDIAESVALYVLLPEYMKTYFPGRYDWIKEKAFHGKEFEISFEVPISLASRLYEG